MKNRNEIPNDQKYFYNAYVSMCLAVTCVRVCILARDMSAFYTYLPLQLKPKFYPPKMKPHQILNASTFLKTTISPIPGAVRVVWHQVE